MTLAPTRAMTVHNIVLATKCANVARSTGTTKVAVQNHDAKRAAAQRTKTRKASSALNTSARNAKARSIRKGTIETIAPYRSPLFARSARKPDTKKIDAQRDRVQHVAFERTDYRHITRVLSNLCTTCNEKGHNRSNCPTTQCDTCGLFGHLPNDCPFATCIDVEIDWLNILLATQSLQTIDSYFEEVSLAPTALRIDGIMRKFDDWEHIQRVCAMVSSENLLQIKRTSHTFKRDANREYDRRMRELNKLTQSPINFAFTTDYTDDSVPKCPFCRTYLFPQETSKKMWCCGGGKMLELYRPWSQPTDDFRNHCTGDFANAKLFRSESRRLNMTFAFAAYGIKYGQVDSSRKPPYFLKINGIPYYRILTVGNETDEPTNPLHMYMYDSQYKQPGEKKPLPDTLRTIVKNCMLQCNDLAQKLRQLPTEHNIDEVTLHIESDANTARAPSDIAALIVKPKGVAKATPRTLVIYPHNDAFLQDHPTKAGQQGYFIPFNSSLWDVVTCPLLTIGGTKDQGWGMADSGRQENFGTVTEHARFRLLVPELKADATGKFERNADGSAILDPRWFAKTQTGLLFPFSRISCLGKLASQWMIDQWIRR